MTELVKAALNETRAYLLRRFEETKEIRYKDAVDYIDGLLNL